MASPIRWTKMRRVMLSSRAKDTQGKAGRLFEHMLAETLNCEISPRGRPELADLYSNDLGIRIESKSKGDVNIPELRVNQIREYEEEPPFPLHYSLYALTLYKSTRRMRDGEPRPRGISSNTHMISLMRGMRTDAEYNAFFASQVQMTYLLDLRIIQALEKYLGAHGCRMFGRTGEEAIRISRTKLSELFGDMPFAESLRELGLQPAGWAKGVYPIHVRFRIDGQRLSSKFTLVTLLRRRLHADIAQVVADKTLTLE